MALRVRPGVSSFDQVVERYSGRIVLEVFGLVGTLRATRLRLFELVHPAISRWGLGADRGLSQRAAEGFCLRGIEAAGIVWTHRPGWGTLGGFEIRDRASEFLGGETLARNVDDSGSFLARSKESSFNGLFRFRLRLSKIHS